MSAAAHVTSSVAPMLEQGQDGEGTNALTDHDDNQVSHTQRMLESLCAVPISLGSSPAGSSRASSSASTTSDEIVPVRQAVPLGAADATGAAAPSPSTSGSRVSCTPTDQVVVAATPQHGGSTELTLRNGPMVAAKHPRDDENVTDEHNSGPLPATEKRRRVEFRVDEPTSTDDGVPRAAAAAAFFQATGAADAETMAPARAVGVQPSNGSVVEGSRQQDVFTAWRTTTAPHRSFSAAPPLTSLPAEQWQAFCETEIPNRSALRFALRMLASNVPADVIPFASLVAMRAVSSVDAAKACTSSL